MKPLGPYPFLPTHISGDESYNPLVLVHRTLALYNHFIKHKSKNLRERFLGCAESLVKRIVLKDEFGVWPYYCLFWRAQIYGCKIPWVSALTQGQAISALTRAYGLTGNQKYIATAKYALGSFNVEMKDGGVLSVDSDDGDWWYEEYSCASSVPSGVLNGFILALLGIYDFYLLTKDRDSKYLFNQGILTLCHHLSDFDTNCPYKLTYYDRNKHIVSIDYHIFHTELLKELHRITGKKIFRKCQQKWEEYKHGWTTCRNYRWLHKIYYVKSGYSLRGSLELLVRKSLARACVHF